MNFSRNTQLPTAADTIDEESSAKIIDTPNQQTPICAKINKPVHINLSNIKLYVIFCVEKISDNSAKCGAFRLFSNFCLIFLRGGRWGRMCIIFLWWYMRPLFILSVEIKQTEVRRQRARFLLFISILLNWINIYFNIQGVFRSASLSIVRKQCHFFN